MTDKIMTALGFALLALLVISAVVVEIWRSTR